MANATQAGAEGRTYGKTVGRALIRSYMHDFENRNNPAYKPLYTQAQFNRMVSGLRSETEQRIYGQYVLLYNGLVEEFARAHGYYQQAQNALGRLLAYLSDARRAEEARRLLAQLSPEGGEAAQALLALFQGMDEIERDEAAQQELRALHGELLVPALRWIIAYNALIDHLADAYELPQLRLLAIEEETLQAQLEAYSAGAQALPLSVQGNAVLAAELFAPAHWPSLDAQGRAESFAQAEDIASFENTTVQRLVLQLMGAAR